MDRASAGLAHVFQKGVILAVLATAAPAGATRTAAQIRVGPVVQVSATRSGEAHYEVAVASHSTDPRRLLVGSMLQPVGSGMVSGSIAYVSEDGGATWRATLETPPADSRAATSGDLAVAFGPDGSAWFVASLIPPNSGRSSRDMLLYLRLLNTSAEALRVTLVLSADWTAVVYWIRIPLTR